MKTWFTASELGLILGLSKRSVHRKANKENWQFNLVEDKGGQRREYHLSSLPEETQLYLKETAKKEAIPEKKQESFELLPVAAPVATISKEPELINFADQTNRRIAINCAIVEAYYQFREEFNQYYQHPEFLCQLNFCHQYRRYELEYLEKESGCFGLPMSLTTLQRKIKAYNEGDYRFLGATHGGARRKSTIWEQCPDLEDAVLSILSYANCKVRPRQVLTLLKTYFEFSDLPTEKQVRTYCQKLKEENPALYTKLAEGDDGMRRKLTPAFGKRDQDIERINQQWQLDSTKADIMLNVGGKLKRYNICGCIDVATRRVNFLVSETSSSNALKLLMRATILEWGKPEAVKTDNGKDYVSQAFNGFLASLGIEVLLCLPGRPDMKPFIERIFKTLQHDVFELLPGFVGHNISERVNRRNTLNADVVNDQAMTPEQLQTWLDQWTIDYHNRTHGTLKVSPNQKYLELAKNWTKTEVSERALDFLLLSGTNKKVNAQGIKHNGRCYVAGALGGIMGQTVHIRYGPESPYIQVYRDDSLKDFICTAQDRDLATDLPEIAYQAKLEQRKAINSEAKKLKKQASKLAERIAENPQGMLSNQNIVTFDNVSKREFSSQLINNIERSIETQKELTQLPETPTQQELERREAKFNQLNQEIVEKPQDPTSRYKDLLNRQKGGESLCEIDLAFMKRFEKTSQGQAVLRILNP